MSDERRDAAPMLTVENLTTGYGETAVLHGLGLEVREGEVLALVGRNGAGKTTTLRSISGALDPWSGSIRYRGEEISGLDPHEVTKLGIGYVPEERRVFPGLTVRENLEVGSFGETAATHRRDVAWALDTFQNLGERANSRGTDLSGGEQQMLAVARALVAGADLLMLDEPTEGLAPLVVQQVADLIRDVRDDGVTTLLVEQNLAVALDLADRVCIVDQGAVVFEGTPDEVEAEEDLIEKHLGVSH